jgi:hypothetical protein
MNIVLVIGIILTILKIVGVIDTSWWIISVFLLFPFWAAFAFIIVGLLLYLIIVLIGLWEKLSKK